MEGEARIRVREPNLTFHDEKDVESFGGGLNGGDIVVLEEVDLSEDPVAKQRRREGVRAVLSH